jgi:hypothetical protein
MCLQREENLRTTAKNYVNVIGILQTVYLGKYLEQFLNTLIV